MILILCWTAPRASADHQQLDNVMYEDPVITFPEPIRVFSDRLVPLWLEALESPEVDLQRQAAESFARAHVRGLRNLEAVIQPLVKKVSSPESHPIVRLAAARALITLDAKQSAAALFEFARQSGLDEAQVVEPALAKWDYQPIREVWLARLEEAQPSRRRINLAISGLADVGEANAIPKLQRLVESSSTSPGVRLDAAQKLGRLKTNGLEGLATDLMGDISPRGVVDRLIAASLLDRHSSESALALLERLAVDEEPSVAAIALERLFEFDPDRIVALADQLLNNRDANVRHFVAQAFFIRPTISTIEQLATLLNDPHPRNRQFVRRSLIELAKQQPFDATIRAVAMETLSTDQWTGLEQAARVLVALDHKPAADRLAELLEFERPEVFVTAAWALRKLAVRAKLPAMLDRAGRMAKDDSGSAEEVGAVDLQVAHLFQAFSQMGFREAEPLMRQYIPKGSHPLQSRAAAIWALGHFHAGKPDPKLTTLFAERLADVENPADPESMEVCRMAAISLGRMKAQSTVPELRHFLAGYTVNEDLGYACAWAIQQITDEQPPQQAPRIVQEIGWFLEPLANETE